MENKDNDPNDFRAETLSTDDSSSRPYENEVMQSMNLKWGRIFSVVTVEDAQKFQSILPNLVAAGIKDASEKPIND